MLAVSECKVSYKGLLICCKAVPAVSDIEVSHVKWMIRKKVIG